MTTLGPDRDHPVRPDGMVLLTAADLLALVAAVRDGEVHLLLAPAGHIITRRGPA